MITPESHVPQIICRTNRLRVVLNQVIREKLGRKDSNLPEPGDRLICLKNGNGLFNGTMGIVREIDKRNLTLETEDGHKHYVQYDPTTFNQEKYEPDLDAGNFRTASVPFEFGYAISCHKAQGGEWNNVIVFEEWSRWSVIEWNYTAATRAKNSLIWVSLN